MYCVNCGAEIPQGQKFCENCGQTVGAVKYVNVPSEPVIEYVVPEENRPISAWGYIGYNILFAIPIIGFIAVIILSFNKNINVRNRARSFWCALLIWIVVGIILIIVGVDSGTVDEIYEFLQAIWRY